MSTAAAAVPTTAPPGDVYAYTHTGEMSPAVSGVPARVYVPNTKAATVDVIDPVLHTLYVANDEGNSLTPIDPVTGKPGVPVPVDDPYNLYFTPDGTKAVVVAEQLSRLDFRDPHTWQLQQSLTVGCSGVDHADFAADGHFMLASCEFSGDVLTVDVDRPAVIRVLHIGGQPVDVKLSPDGTVFYVANQQTGGVDLIEAASGTRIGFVSTGAGAHGLYPSRDGRLLYVTNRSAGSVTVIDFASRLVVSTWHIGGSPDMGGVSPDSRQLWLSGRYNSAVYVVDTLTGRLLRTIPVGAGPHGLAYFPQPGRFSLGHTGNYR